MRVLRLKFINILSVLTEEQKEKEMIQQPPTVEAHPCVRHGKDTRTKRERNDWADKQANNY